MRQDSFHSTKSEVALDAQTLTNGTVNGNAIDLEGIESVTFHVPQDAYTDGEHTLSVEDAPTGSGPWTAAGADFTLSNVAGQPNDGVLDDAAEDGDVHRIGYNGVENFARLVVVTTGASSGIDLLTSLAVLGDPLTAPIDDTVPLGETS